MVAPVPIFIISLNATSCAFTTALNSTTSSDDTAKLIFYSAFVDGNLEAPKSLLPEVHRLYFEPQYPEFSARTMWTLSNAFNSRAERNFLHDVGQNACSRQSLT